MTEKTCCVSTPEQAKSVEIRDATERPMLDKVFKAVDVAVTEVADGFREVGLEFDPTSGVIFYVHGSAGDIRPPLRRRPKHAKGRRSRTLPADCHQWPAYHRHLLARRLKTHQELQPVANIQVSVIFPRNAFSPFKTTVRMQCNRSSGRRRRRFDPV